MPRRPPAQWLPDGSRLVHADAISIRVAAELQQAMRALERAAASMANRRCWAAPPVDYQTSRCTRDVGHDGEHVATTKRLGRELRWMDSVPAWEEPRDGR